MTMTEVVKSELAPEHQWAADVRGIYRNLGATYHDRVIAAITAETDDPALRVAAFKAISTLPQGKTDGGGRWTPKDAEWQDCCFGIRPPSRDYPWSLWKHCCSIAHIALREGVDEKALRRVVTRARKAAAQEVA